MRADIMKIRVLADGTIKTETDPISPANHQSAEDFLRTVTALTGGAVDRQRKGQDAAQVHHVQHQKAGQ